MSFITVKFGDDEEELFNPNCVTVNLLDNLRRRCGCQKGVTLDLSDEDGEIKNLHEFPTQYAHRILKGREVFILIKVEKGQGDQPTSYTALLNNLEKSNPKLLARLEALSKSSSDAKQSLQRKESLWTTASKLRKLKGGLPSATERKRTEPSPSFKVESKNLTTNTSPQGKNRQRKTSKN
ncbi:uncharacterized protein C22orf15-like [Montipora foliosa]|uniref:uncharacterized protein C22orf15-like n=1 Tax=Montipora foliosa TaxID=591990 RepID=UPI0035F195CF